MRNVLPILFAGILLLFEATQEANADLGSWLFGDVADDAAGKLDEISKKRVRELLEGSKAVSEQAIKQGAKEGRLLGVQLGNELAVLTASAGFVMGNELDKSIGQVDNKLLPLLQQIQRITVRLEQAKDAAIDVEQLSFLDIESIIDQIPFVDRVLAVKRISGVSVIESNVQFHNLAFRGPDFGGDTDEVRTTFVLVVDGKGMQPDIQTRIPASSEVVFKLPQSLFSGKFSDREIVTVPAKLKVRRIEEGILADVVRELEVPFSLALLPRRTGHIQVTESRPQFEWIRAGDPEERTLVFPDMETVTFEVPNPDLDGIPQENEMRVARDVLVKCASNLVSHRKMPNGRLFLSTDIIFKKGWRSGPIPKNSFVQLIKFKEAFDGFSRAFGKVISPEEAFNRTRRSNAFAVSADEMKRVSTEVMVDLSGCDEVTYEAEFQRAQTLLTLTFTGKTKDPAKFKIRLQPERRSTVGVIDTTVLEADVFNQKLLDIDIKDAETVAVKIAFKSITGEAAEMPIGQSANGFNLIKAQSIGASVTRFSYLFQYAPQ